MITPQQAGVRPNPLYGKGVFRRRIHATQKTQQVSVELEDCSHAMRLILRHDHHKILSLEGEVLRAPVTSCQSAPEKLDAFIGMDLSPEVDQYRKALPANHHCTHLYDMALLAIEHGLQERPTVTIDVEVADENQGIIDAAIYRDGVKIHHWQLRDGHIENPVEYRGQSVFRGFATWVNRTYDGNAQRDAFALQRGVMVAHARRWDMFSVIGDPADRFGPGAGVCYSYSEGRDRHAVRSENPTRDFTGTPEQLLRFK